MIFPEKLNLIISSTEIYLKKKKYRGGNFKKFLAFSEDWSTSFSTVGQKREYKAFRGPKN